MAHGEKEHRHAQRVELRQVLGRLRLLRQALLAQQLDQDAGAEQRLRVEEDEPLLGDCDVDTDSLVAPLQQRLERLRRKRRVA